MKAIKKYIRSCVCLLLIFACERVDIDFFNLGDFRLMAVVADFPEVDARVNNNVVLTPWISDVDAQGRLIALNIKACLDPGIGLGSIPECKSSDLGYQTINYIDFDTSTLSGQYFSGVMPGFTVSVPADLINFLSDHDQFNGIDYIVSMVFSAGDEEIKAVKRIRLSTNPDRNQNPKLADVLVNDNVSDPVSDQARLNFTVENGFEEQMYQNYNADGDLENHEESYLLTWFVHGGILSLSRTEQNQDNTFSLKSDVNGEPFVFAILRDNRGGVDVLFKD